MDTTPKKLLDQVRDKIRLKHYSIRTEEAYVNRIRRYLLFHNKHHPKEMGMPEVEAFLTHIAVNENVATFTQSQAFSAMLFLYHEFLKQPLEGRIDAVRAKMPKRLPIVLARQEVLRILDGMERTS